MNKNIAKAPEHQRALDDLNYIKHLTVQTRNSAAEASPYFLIWGIAWIIGYGAEALGFTAILHWIWLFLSIVGMGLTFYTAFRQGKSNPLPSVVERQLTRGFIGFSIAVLLVLTLIFTGFLQFHPEYIGLYSVILISFLYMFIGVALGKEIFLMGIWFAVLAAGNAFLFPPYQPALMALLGGGSIVFTGLMLRQWGREHE